jgi:hypothetical protein
MEGVTSTQEKIPLDVLAIADKMKMTPIAWNIHPSFIVIVFEQGPKMIFHRDVDPVEAILSIPAHLQDESPVLIAPEIQRLPVKHRKRAKYVPAL